MSRGRIVLMAGVLVLASVMGRHLVLERMRQELVALDGRLTEVASEQARTVPAFVALRHEVGALEDSVAHLEPLVGAGSGPPHMLEELHRLAKLADVDITQFKPRGVVDHGMYEEWPAEVSFDGSFHEAARFLDVLSEPPLQASLAGVHVRAHAPSRSSSVRVSVVASALVVPRVVSPAPHDAVTTLASHSHEPRYDDGGRRDPFVRLAALGPTTGAGTTSRPKPGLAGVSLAEVSVRGVLRQGSRMLAILETGGRQSFVVRSSDRLADSSVVSIDPAGVVFAPSGAPGGAPVRKPLAREHEVRR